ncbi:hypothetical protein GCM10009780_25800 [Actinomadura alba]
MKRIAVPSMLLGLALFGGVAPAFASVTRTDTPTPTPTPTTTPTKPTPTPTTEPPEFEFGFDKVTLSTKTITPGGTLTIKVVCPTSVSATSNAFVADPRFATGGDGTFTGSGTFKQTLPEVATLRVECEGYGYVTYTHRPGEEVRPGGSTGRLPSGAPDTGDGSLSGRDGGAPVPLLAGGSAVALAGAAFGVLALRRRERHDQSS